MGDIVPHTSSGNSSALITFKGATDSVEDYQKRIEEANKLEEKLKFIQENVPTRVYNVSGSTAGAGSGDFHAYRIMRKNEQERVKRMEEHWNKKEKVEEYETRRKEREQQAEERTNKKRAKRQKKKAKKKAKPDGVGGNQDGGSDSDEEVGDVPEQADLD